MQASAVQLSNVHWVNRTLCAVDATNDVTAHSSMQGIVDAMGCVAYTLALPRAHRARRLDSGRARVYTCAFGPPPPPLCTHTHAHTHAHAC
jgi:hypothetical protein